jgi:ABC-2 type transport system permease protein
MKIWMAIAKNEARLVWRRRSSWLLWALFLILLSVAALLSHARQSRERQQQEHYQALVRQQWLEQPDRHPHRVAHYGSFAFKPRSLLAGFDPGVEAQVGRVQYLEAHRQNALNFAEAGALTAAGRLGELSPALVAGPLLALVIAMLGHGVLAEERELGRLSLLCAQGVGSVMLTWGKAAGLALAVMPFFILVPLTQGAAVLLSPAEPSFAETLLDGDGPLVRGALLMLGLLLHALIWVLITVLVSKLSRTRAHSAAVLLCLWLCTMVVLPRAASGLAASLHPLPTRSDFTAHMAAELEKLGDSHNPDDPAFVRFREETLRRHGVKSVEELPLNYKGILMAEGERQTSQVFQAEMQALQRVMSRQESVLTDAAWLSPQLSLQHISASLCGTDALAARSFAAQAEDWRFSFIQRLNDLQRDHISYEHNATQRLENEHWREFDDFEPHAPGLEEVLQHSRPAWLRLGAAGVVLALAAGIWPMKRRALA